jgi:hypothetical protein
MPLQSSSPTNIFCDYMVETDRGAISLAKAVASVLGITGNFNAVVDPTAASDATQGYTPGAMWYNQSNSRVWMCMSNAKGAAIWALDGVVPGVGVEPGSMITQLGSGAATFPEEGNISRTALAVGAGVSPGSIGNDNVLLAYSLPANSFDGVAGTNRGLNIAVSGSFGATGNNKDIKIWWGCTTAVVGSAVTGGVAIADTGVVTTNGGGWALMANVFKYGAANSNTQLGVHTQAQVGNAVAALLAPQNLTAVENAPILIAITGNANTAASDIVLNWVDINAMN